MQVLIMSQISILNFLKKNFKLKGFIIFLYIINVPNLIIEIKLHF